VFRYIKYYRLYNSEYHREKTWYYKENDKLTPPRLATKKTNLTLISSNMSIVKKTIKQTATLVLIGKTVSIKSGMVENNRNSVLVEYSNVAILLSISIIVFLKFTCCLSLNVCSY